ncbi:Sterol 24-c-methyltransferase [Seminavis robusta]|uniref:Sterol 24-c-methyltransferase n=1 Tax=Seminavis robusta TaxID=568900 RepID=A0A9N8DPE0_9STRA|nr:Sterol 24-c-methyltransferase [Seminavis robusta]|eukprot:Sro263_g102140.1 Sterol 24-c-methyltransferase (393) ;mRNA; r:2051-3229
MSGYNVKGVVLSFGVGLAAGAYMVARSNKKEKPDPAKKAEQHLWKVAEYSLTSGLIRVCDELQLYDALWESGPSTAAELAQKMNCSERWLTEILSQATAAGICVYFFGKFCLKPEYAHLLRDPKKAPRSMQGLFEMVYCMLDRRSATVESIKSGLGVDYDYEKSDISAAIDRKNSNWFENKLEDDVLKNVKAPKSEKSLVDMLEAGIQVADIGCGFGASTVQMAKRFPKSHFCAFEASQKALLKIKERVEAAGLTNVTVCNVLEKSLAEGSSSGGKFDFIYVHDVIHDMTEPKKFLKEAKKGLSPDGCMVVVDIACSDNLKENIARPDAAGMYGFSCFLCLACSTSKKGGAGLGTCGFPESVARKWTGDEGFEFFEVLEIESLPSNVAYVVA